MSVQLQLVSFIQKQNGIQRNTSLLCFLCVSIGCRTLNKNENIINAGYWVLSENHKN